MDIDKPILDFLAEPDNLSMAFEISEYLEKLKLEMHQEFWETFNSKMHEKANVSEVPENWQLALFPMNKIRSSKWEGCYVFPNIRPKPKHFLQFTISQSSGQRNYNLAIGIVWNVHPNDWSNSSLEKLISTLKLRGISQKEKRWPSWDYHKYQLEGAEFIVQMAQDMNAAVDEVLNEWWDLFLEIRPLMEEVNRSVTEYQNEQS